jgi:predicted glycosyltransferase
MKILFDIKHPAQLNLFKGISKELQEENWEVTICYLQRGKLPGIIKKEYPGFNTVPVGSSNGTKWSILWHGNIKRTLAFLDLIKKENYNICVAASSIPLALACKIAGIPVIQFYDDPERKRINRINASLSSQLFFPPIVEKNNKVSVFNCLKEWSYLSPNRFNPAERTLNQYKLAPYEYIFVREVSNKSFNYYNQQDGIISSFAGKINANTKVILSLEDKSYAERYPKHWTILQEPVEDIHSLIYYSRMVISSGDSMAREGAMLGVPSIYCGMRKMKANELLMQAGLLQHLPGESALPVINKGLSEIFDQEKQSGTRNRLLQQWDDMTIFMKEQINRYKS